MMTDKNQIRTFNVTYELYGRSVGKMRNEVNGRQIEPSIEPEFNMASDEAGFHGGEGSAPLPLAYFCTGLVTCLMTQIRAFAKRLRINLDGVDVDAVIKWQASSEGGNPYEATPVQFLLDVDMKTNASLEDQTRLLEAAKKGCFIEATLANPIPVNHRIKLGQDFIEVD
ncbi:MAG: OsmC family protein [Pseudomonadota bacterium]|nr:OsmC family protein [Pseudomonadota bacterium]